MPVISVRIPQLGEGLREALLVDLLKLPGDQIRRDDPIYTMETDKAATDVESPYDGRLVQWLVEPGELLSIGTEIAKIEVAEGIKEMPTHDSQNASQASKRDADAVSNDGTGQHPLRSSDVLIPPKTRRFLKDHQLLESVHQIPAAGEKLLISDVEAWLATILVSENEAQQQYDVTPLPKSQIVLNYRLKQGVSSCIPVTAGIEMSWNNIQTARKTVKAAGGSASGFAMACFAIVQALKTHERFRSTLSSDEKSLLTYRDVNLGVAVTLPGDELVTAVVRGADKMTQAEFFDAYAAQIATARRGIDQADASTTLTVSNIGKAGLRFGIPAIVAPAVATLALGKVYPLAVPDGDGFRFEPTLECTLCFDHRVANGVGAARFMNDIKEGVEQFSLIDQ